MKVRAYRLIALGLAATTITTTASFSVMAAEESGYTAEYQMESCLEQYEGYEATEDSSLAEVQEAYEEQAYTEADNGENEGFEITDVTRDPEEVAEEEYTIEEFDDEAVYDDDTSVDEDAYDDDTSVDEDDEVAEEYEEDEDADYTSVSEAAHDDNTSADEDDEVAEEYEEDEDEDETEEADKKESETKARDFVMTGAVADKKPGASDKPVVKDYSTKLSDTKKVDKAQDKDAKSPTKDLANMGLTVMKDTVDGAISVFTKAYPYGALITGSLKDIVFGSLGVGGNDIGKKLDDLTKQVKETGKDINQYTSNTVSIGIYGTELDHLKSATQNVLKKIKDITKSDMSENEKEEKLAKLCDTGTDSLEETMNTITDIFKGKSMSRADRGSIYDVLYDSVVKQSLFSGEAIDRTAPYLHEAMTRFVEANRVLDILLTAKENVYGKDKTRESRAQMAARFAGTVDENGKSNNDGILQKYADYFSKDRCVYINQGNENVKFDPDVLVYSYSNHDEVKKVMQMMEKYGKDITVIKKMPMNPVRLENIKNYLKDLEYKGKKGSLELMDYFDTVGFKFKGISDKNKVYNVKDLKTNTLGAVFDLKK